MKRLALIISLVALFALAAVGSASASRPAPHVVTNHYCVNNTNVTVTFNDPPQSWADIFAIAKNAAYQYALHHSGTVYDYESESFVPIASGMCPLEVTPDVDHGFLTNTDRTQLLVVDCQSWQDNMNPDFTVTLADGIYNVPVAVANGDGSYKLLPAAPKGSKLTDKAVGGDFYSTGATVFTWTDAKWNACVYPVAA